MFRHWFLYSTALKWNDEGKVEEGEEKRRGGKDVRNFSLEFLCAMWGLLDSGYGAAK